MPDNFNHHHHHHFHYHHHHHFYHHYVQHKSSSVNHKSIIDECWNQDFNKIEFNSVRVNNKQQHKQSRWLNISSSCVQSEIIKQLIPSSTSSSSSSSFDNLERWAGSQRTLFTSIKLALDDLIFASLWHSTKRLDYELYTNIIQIFKHW